MGTFIQLFVDGLSTGSIYAALALAIVLVNQATGLINFAQGGMAVLSAYIAWSLTIAGLPLILALLVSIVASFILGALIERFLMRRFEGGDPDTAVVATIGLLTLITGICAWIWSYNNQLFPSLFPVEGGAHSGPIAASAFRPAQGAYPFAPGNRIRPSKWEAIPGDLYSHTFDGSSGFFA